MTEKNLPDEKPKAQSRSLKAVLSKTELEHKYKLGLMRECQIYGKSLKECKVYFADKGYSLSKTLFTKMRNELKSRRSAKNWFSKEALFIIEEDHMIQVETGRAIVADLVKEYWEAEDINEKLRIASEWESLSLTMTKIYSATPMVQELMEVHARQEVEESTPPKQEEPQHAK